MSEEGFKPDPAMFDEVAALTLRVARPLIWHDKTKGWPKVLEHVGVFSGKRVKRFDTLPPGEELLFGEVLEEAFRQPGIYRVRWEGEGFRSPEMMFRVMLTTLADIQYREQTDLSVP